MEPIMNAPVHAAPMPPLFFPDRRDAGKRLADRPEQYRDNPDVRVLALPRGVPVAAPRTYDAFRAEMDEVICAITPSPFSAVGDWYRDFSQTSDAEVRDLLEQAAQCV
jgi:predicted phosphoribosyltransferase